MTSGCICSAVVVRPGCCRSLSFEELMFRRIGSLQLCPDIPADLKAVYSTMWDLDPIDLIDMAADRAPFIDQSQSLTLGIRRPTSDLMVRIPFPSTSFVFT